MDKKISKFYLSPKNLLISYMVMIRVKCQEIFAQNVEADSTSFSTAIIGLDKQKF